MKLLDNRSLIRLQILNIILVLSLVAMGWLLEGCTVELEMDPIEVTVPEIEISIVQDMDCDHFDLYHYLSYPVCDNYNRADCCNMRWSQVCMISFCEGCIGLDAGCLGDKEDDKED